MIADLDLSLEALLRLELPDHLQNVDITFATPDRRTFPPESVTLPAIDLFLYDIRENTTLRSNQSSYERDSRAVYQRRPAVRVDCSYMITAWSGSPDSALDEHRLLSEVMRVLLTWRHLPQSVLVGELRNQQPPLPTTCLQPSLLQSLGEFWQALDGTPKAALSYTVTINVQPGVSNEAEPPVVESILKVSEMADSS